MTSARLAALVVALAVLLVAFGGLVLPRAISTPDAPLTTPAPKSHQVHAKDCDHGDGARSRGLRRL